MPTADDVRQVLDYDPETGEFRWAVDRFKGPQRKALCARKGDLAGGFNAKGYRQISVSGRNHGAHRLAWLLMTGEWPTHQIDHINRDPADNRWCNLRPATRSENMCNQRVRRDNRLGCPGVYLHRGRFIAQIGKGGRQYNIGSFGSVGEAMVARQAAERLLHGEFARSNYAA